MVASRSPDKKPIFVPIFPVTVIRTGFAIIRVYYVFKIIIRMFGIIIGNKAVDKKIILLVGEFEIRGDILVIVLPVVNQIRIRF